MKRIALFTPSKHTYSETFIQLHIDGLNHVNWVYHDGEQPTKCNDVSFPPLSKWTIRFLNWRYNRKWGWEQWSLFQSLKMNQPDVVYFEYGTTAVANIEVVELLNIATITNFHGFDISVFDILKKNQERYRNLFLNTNNRFVVVSKKMLNRIVEMGAREKSILYSPCGANMEYQKIVPNLNSKQFVMLGRLVEKKSPLSSLKAFYQVYQRDKEVRLAIIGNGPLMSNCEEFVQKNNLMDAVIFHGVLDREGIMKVFAESSCFIQHSIVASNGDEEGTPVAILEAMLSGLVVVSTRHAGIADVVKEDCGYLVEEDAIAEMAESMYKAVSNTDVSSVMSKNARQFVLAHHTSEIHLEQINSFL